MFGKVDAQKKSFLDQAKAQRDDRAYEKKRQIAVIKIQVRKTKKTKNINCIMIKPLVYIVNCSVATI